MYSNNFGELEPDWDGYGHMDSSNYFTYAIMSRPCTLGAFTDKLYILEECPYIGS